MKGGGVQVNPSVSPNEENPSTTGSHLTNSPMMGFEGSVPLGIPIAKEIPVTASAELETSLVADEKRVYLTWQNVYFSVPLKKSDKKTMER